MFTMKRHSRYPSFNDFIKLCVKNVIDRYVLLSVDESEWNRISVFSLTFDIKNIGDNLCDICEVLYQEESIQSHCVIGSNKNTDLQYDYTNDILLNDIYLNENKYDCGVELHFSEVLSDLFIEIPKFMGG
jgi:hypothetical protein